MDIKKNLILWVYEKYDHDLITSDQALEFLRVIIGI